MKKIVKLFVLVLMLIPLVTFTQVLEWKKCYGGSDEEMAYQIIQAHNEGFLIVGSTKSSDGDVSTNYGSSDFWVIKIDDAGEILWEKTFGSDVFESAAAVTATNDGAYVVTGRKNFVDGMPTNSDFWVLKIDDTGNILWENSFGGSSFDIPSHIISTNDDGYIISGVTFSNDGDVTGNENNKWAAWIIKINNDGNLIWEKCFLVSGCVNFGSSVLSSENGVVFTASVCENTSDFLIVKLDEDGNTVWQKGYGGSLNDNPHAIRAYDGGGYVIVGEAASNDGLLFDNNGSFDFWVLNIDANGEYMTSFCYGGSNPDKAFDVALNNTYELIIVGVTESDDGDVRDENDFGDFWIVNADIQGTGEMNWEMSLGDSIGRDVATSVVVLEDNSYIIAGYTCSIDGNIVTGNHGASDFWVVKMAESSNAVTNTGSDITCNVYPNPATDEVTIEVAGLQDVEIISVSGSIVRHFEIKSNLLNLSGLARGLYFIKIQTEQGMVVEKIILE